MSKSQLLWVPARHGGVLFTSLQVGTGPARLGTAQPSAEFTNNFVNFKFEAKRKQNILFLFFFLQKNFFRSLALLIHWQTRIKTSKIPTKDNPKKTPKVPPMLPTLSGKVTLASFKVNVAN